MALAEKTFSFERKAKAPFYLSLILLAAIVVSLVLLNGIKKRIQRDIGYSMETILETTMGGFKIWRGNISSAAQVLAGIPEVVSAVQAQLRVPRDSGVLRSSEALTRLDQVLEPALKSYGFLGYALIDSEYINRASLLKTNIGIRNLLAGQEGFLEKIFRGRTDISLPVETDIPIRGGSGELNPNEPTMFVAAPVYDESKNLQAVLAFRLDPSMSFSRIFQLGRMGNTGETYALNKAGKLVTESRFDSHLREIGLVPPGRRGILSIEIRDPGGDMVHGFRPKMPRHEQPLTYMAGQVTRGLSGSNLEGYRDYRGVEVLGVWRWDEDLSMGITTEIDAAEAFATYEVIRIWVVSGISGLCLLFMGYWGSLLNQSKRDRRSNLELRNEIEKREKLEETLLAANALLSQISSAQSQFILEKDPHVLFNELLESVLQLTQSEFGFVGEILHDAKGEPYLKTYQVTDISWNDETRELYKINSLTGFEFHNLKTLFGEVIVTARPVISNDPSADPRAGGLPSGHPALKSFCGLPLFKGAELIGMFGLANRPGGYDESLIERLQPLLSVTGIIVSAYQENRKRQIAEKKLRENEAYIETVIQNMVVGLVTIDEKGIVEAFNPASERLFGYPASEIIGQSVNMLMPEPHRAQHDQYLRNYLETGQSKIIGIGREVIGKRKDGSHFPLQLSVAESFRGGRRLLIGNVEDNTERRETERVLKKQSASLRLLGNVAAMANEAKTSREAIQAGLELICEFTGWPVGYYSALNKKGGQNAGFFRDWYVNNPAQNKEFKAMTDLADLPLGIGLLGRILASGQPIWVQDVTQDRGFPGGEMALNMGIQGACGFPVLIGSEIVGVMEFFNPEPMEPDEAFGDLAGQIGGQMGCVIERERYSGELKMLSLALEQSPSSIFFTDVNGRIEYVNPCFIEATGYTHEEIIGKTPRVLKSGKHSRRFYKELWDTLLSGNTWKGDICNRKKNGGLFWEYTAISSIKDTNGVITHFVSTRIDDTQRKRAEEALRKREADLARAQCIAHLGSWEWFVTENKIILSREACRIFGLNQNEFEGTYEAFLEMVHTEDRSRVNKGIRGTIDSKFPHELDCRIVRTDGAVRFIHALTEVASDEAGARNKITGIIQDISERKLMEDQLHHSQKLESIGELAAGIAHEINTPMQFIGDNIRFLQDSFKDLLDILGAQTKLLSALKGGRVDKNLLDGMNTAMQKADLPYLVGEIPQAIEQSLEGTRRVTKIVRAMKMFSHPGDEEISSVDINQAIQTTITVSTNEWKYVADMVTGLDPDLPLVSSRANEFSQVILNIVVNAAHAIETALKGKGTITISTRQDGDWAEIRIRDTGTGIPETIRTKIFDPFFTTKEVGRGTGQGLAIVHGIIVKRLRGTISLETEMGKGTTFIIRLPISQIQHEDEGKENSAGEGLIGEETGKEDEI